MKELEIELDVLMCSKLDIEGMITDFTLNGRKPNNADFLKMKRLLEAWGKTKDRIECLDEIRKNIANRKSAL